MIITSFLIQYFAMSYITVNSISNITNSLGKFYLSSLMAFLMAIMEVMMYDFNNKMLSWNYYIVLLLLISIFYLLYTMQIGINDKEYLKEMIEHHSMALSTSEEIENKSSNYKVKKLAHDIISSQSEQIKYMKKILQIV
jgi:uncharacterized protein (DUF305 family)